MIIRANNTDKADVVICCTKQSKLFSLHLHPQHRIMFISLSDGCGISTGNGDAEPKDAGLGIQSSYMNNSTKAYHRVFQPFYPVRNHSWEIYYHWIWFSHFPLSSSQPGGRVTQHFGLISPHRCYIVSPLLVLAQHGVSFGPLTVGCHNDIQQSREAWQRSGWVRWRGRGGVKQSWSWEFQQGWGRGRWPQERRSLRGQRWGGRNSGIHLLQRSSLPQMLKLEKEEVDGKVEGDNKKENITGKCKKMETKKERHFYNWKNINLRHCEYCKNILLQVHLCLN